jgi:hypothetical protein
MSAVELMGENLNVKHHVTEWENRCIKAERERDEARQQYDDLATEHVLAINKLAEERDQALMDRDDGDMAIMTRNHYERILKERDEANEELSKKYIEFDQLFDAAEKIKIDRDEARELLRILAGLVAYGLGQSGEEWSLEAMRQATAAIQNAKFLEATK